MTNIEMVSTIKNHEVFSGLPESSWQELHNIVSLKIYSKDETVFKINEAPVFLYYIVSGDLSLYFPNNKLVNYQDDEIIGEIGLLNGDFRLGTLKANDDSKVIRICAKKIFDKNYVSVETSLHITRILSKRITNYLRSTIQISSKELIAQGEHEKMEFKSTMRWNLKANKRDKAITHAVLKTIAAFLNTEGGILFVGVSDEGEILGLEKDGFENEDKMLLFLTNSIKSNLGALQLQHIHFHVEEMDGKEFLRVDVEQGTSPSYIKHDKDDDFYIRTGPSTNLLRTSKIYEYISERFS